MKKLRIIITMAACFFMFTTTDHRALAHPGALDSSGCHHNRKTGEYHCHRDGSASGDSGYREIPQKRGKLEVIPAPPPQQSENVKVVGITDGDTIKVLIDGQQVKIRLYGIDAPESGQAFGVQAQTALKQITSGRKINLKTIDTDRYGRSVSLVYADGANINEIMVLAGYAWVYPQYCKQSFCNAWRQKENSARNSHSGLWRDNQPTPPWEWRHNK